MIDHVAKETSKLSLIGLNDIQRKYSMKQKKQDKTKNGTAYRSKRSRFKSFQIE